VFRPLKLTAMILTSAFIATATEEH
jgi:hypothetical protein